MKKQDKPERPADILASPEHWHERDKKSPQSDLKPVDVWWIYEEGQVIKLQRPIKCF